MIRNILKMRTGTLWTASKAHTFNLPYRTSGGISTSGLCPLCPNTDPNRPPPPDTQGHIFGSCSHPQLKSYYIARHNQALCKIYKAISLGTKASSYTIMDATSRHALPHGIMGTRLPAWLLPTVTPAELDLLRPDILLIDGLTQADLTALTTSTPSPLALLTIQQHCLIHILELTYNSEICRSTSLSQKRTQHSKLVSLLCNAGWTLHSNTPNSRRPPQIHTPHISVGTHIPYLHPATSTNTLPTQPSHDLSQFIHIIQLGTSGIIYSTLPSILTTLGIPSSAVAPLLDSLNIHAVRFAHSIIHLRRRLEKLPSCFHSTTHLPHHPFQPP